MNKLRLTARDAYYKTKEVRDNKLGESAGIAVSLILPEVAYEISQAIDRGIFECTFEKKLTLGNYAYTDPHQFNNIATLLKETIEDSGYRVKLIDCGEPETIKVYISWAAC